MEAIIYPIIAGKYLTYQSLLDGTATFEQFIKAKRMIKFEEWYKGVCTQASTAKEEVEYFD